METIVIKISGALAEIEDSAKYIAEFIRDCSLKEIHVVIIHGGGAQINELCDRLGIKYQKFGGRRVTSSDIINVMMYTVGGRINKTMISSLRKNHINAVGICGADGELTTAKRRAPIWIDNQLTDFLLVGELSEVDTNLIEALLNGNFTPVIGCLTWSEEDGILNINADTLAMEIAAKLKSQELIVLMQPVAVMSSDGKRLNVIDEKLFKEGETQGWISDGMRPKLKTGFDAIRNGCNSVRLTNLTGLKSKKGTVLKS